MYAVCGVPSKQLDEAAATAARADPFSANSFLTSQLREGALKIRQVPLPVWSVHLVAHLGSEVCRSPFAEK